MRYFFEISYNGKNFHGWQIQKNALTIQEVFNRSLEKVLRKKIETHASGRTDTGVHALQQFVQLDIPEELTPQHLYKINRLLPEDIAVVGFRKVRGDASARFDAICREYEYHISSKKNPFTKDFSYHFPSYADDVKMNEVSQLLLQHQDFESFSKVKTAVGHFLCSITHAKWERSNDKLVFRIQANRFLRGMVRTIVGTLLEVGTGRMSFEEFEKIILTKNRMAAGRAVPPEGLFLTKVTYPQEIFIM